MSGKIIVIGAGPAGMFAALTAAGMGADVTVVEKNSRQGRKLNITGKGRCNITNSCSVPDLVQNCAVGGRFLYGAFSRFGPQDTMDFFEERGVPLKVERGNRVFPVSDRAMDINDALVACCKERGVRFMTDAPATGVTAENGRIVSVSTENRELRCGACIIATGGASYPATGSTGDGYEFARSLGHTITPLAPSLVPLETAERDCAEMQGLALKNIAVTVTDEKGKRVYNDFGELLFTHFGLSGPVILSASSHMKAAEGHKIAIDLKPALSPEKLDERVLRDFSEQPNRDFANSLGGLLPKSMIPVIVRRSGIPPETKVNSVTRQQRQTLVSLLKGYTLTVTAFRPIDEAIVTSGGVSTKEIDPKTMRSKLVGGLYFAGEVIDADAHTGGFNLQIALSTGHCAGCEAADEVINLDT